jgi:hypothetical protein
MDSGIKIGFSYAIIQALWARETVPFLYDHTWQVTWGVIIAFARQPI